MLKIIIISIALSIDALGIGVSYAMKKVRFPFYSRLIIGIVSGAIMWGAMTVGNALQKVFPSQVTKIFGIGILAVIGLEFIRKSLFGKEKTYDFDSSHKIEGFEALILGMALSADSISAGIAISSLGYSSIYIPILVGVMQIVFLLIGDFVIRKSNLSKRISDKACGIFSGVLLLIIALIRTVS